MINERSISSVSKVYNSEINFFSTPHLVVDDIFSSQLINEINDMWPSNGFINEVKGNAILPIYSGKYRNLKNWRFWENFNEEIWPFLIASIAKKFESFGMHLFGENYKKYISLDHPLTLMQANDEFIGHDMHTHFYHAPHWVFTVLIYIDNLDSLSEGTSLHTLQPLIGGENFGSSCIIKEIDRTTDVAFDTFRWLDPLKPDRKYLDLPIQYKTGRLFTFLDGPLSLHSVKNYKNINGKIDLIKRNPGLARRRILRSHVKVHHQPFYENLSKDYGTNIDPTDYMKLMSFDPILTDYEKLFKDKYLYNIYKNIVKKHGELQRITTIMENNIESIEYSSPLIKKLKFNFFNKNNNLSNDYTDIFLNRIP
jgi:hypothetical protein